MNNQRRRGWTSIAAVFPILFFAVCTAGAQTTAFTYQGKLTDAGAPANGNYDIEFKLFDTVTTGTGSQQGGTIVINPVAAVSGIFTVTLDFGVSPFTGANRFLEVGVRPAGSGVAYTVLAPRQAITAVPYALETINAQQLGGLPASRYIATAANGNVGVGTSTPTSKVEIAAQDGLAITGYQPFLTLRDANAANQSAYVQGVNGDAVLLSNSKHFLTVRNGTGNVGLGTPTPVHHLEINGGPGWTGNGWQGAIAVSDASAIGWQPNAAGNAFGVGQTTGGFYIFNTTSSPGTTGSAANYLMQIADNGDLVQRPYNGGLLKAALLINSDGSVNLCYNSQTPGTCGITVNHFATSQYDITFPFQINSRFFGVTPAMDANLIIHSYEISARPTSVQTLRVYTGAGFDNAFYLNVF